MGQIGRAVGHDGDHASHPYAAEFAVALLKQCGRIQRRAARKCLGKRLFEARHAHLPRLGGGNDVFDDAEVVEVLRGEAQAFGRLLGALGVLPEDAGRASGEMTE